MDNLNTDTNRGCYIRGCLVCCAFAAVALVIAAVMMSRGLNDFRQIQLEFLSDVPGGVPVQSLSTDEQAAARHKWDAFSTACRDRTGGQFLFSAVDINALIADAPSDLFPGAMVVYLNGDRIDADMSLSLEKMSMGKRFLNGNAMLSVSVDDGQIAVRIVDFTVDSRPLPDHLLNQLRRRDLVNANAHEHRQALEGGIASVAISTGQLIVTVHDSLASPK